MADTRLVDAVSEYARLILAGELTVQQAARNLIRHDVTCLPYRAVVNILQSKCADWIADQDRAVYPSVT